MSDVTEPRQRRRVGPAVWWLAASFVVLVALATGWGIPNEESDLATRSEAALRSAGLVGIDVEIDGRDAILTGETPDPADIERAADVIHDLTGIRRVDAAGVAVAMASTDTTASPSATAPAPATTHTTVTLALDGGRVVLSGTVPSVEDHELIRAAADAQFGAANVDDRLMVVDGATAIGWSVGASDVFAALAVLEAGSVTIDADGAVVAGSVAASELIGPIGTSVADATGLPVDNQLIALATPDFSASAVDRSVILTGVLPTQGDVDAVVSAAEAVYDTVDARDLRVADVAGSEWIGALPALVQTGADWQRWSVHLSADGSFTDGIAPDAASLDAHRASLEGLGVEVVDASELDPAAVAAGLTDLLSGSATFETGSAVLSVEATSLLDQAIELLALNPSTVLTVEGHTDDQGAEAANQALSESRAQAVVDYLVAGGIDTSRLTAVGFGESQPIADNTSAEGRAENRRIEFVVETGGEG